MVMSSLSSRDITGCKTDGKLNWNLNLSDESGDEEQLTALVRNSYIKHLKRCLSKNYERWSKTNISIEELNFCSEMLEKKALRSCMVTSIYQRTMAQIVREIKEATQNETLYDAFQKKLNLFENFKCDKETQTIAEQLEIKKENIVCVDEVLLNNNNSNSSFSNSKTLFLETFGETEATINKKLEQDANGTDSYEELLNILLSSPRGTTKSETNLEECERLKESPSLCKKRKLLNGSHEPDRKNIAVQKVEIANVNICTQHDTQVDNIAGASRLSNIPEEKNTNKSKTSLLVNWSYELLVQNTHLENILSKLKPYKRVIVEKRFKDLFGNDLIAENDMVHPNISEEELNSCRKRIARIIVGELTPFYVGGQIGSRPVFKNLAKKLTDDIMCTTFTPEPESIRNTVQGLFMNGKQINSLKDVF